MPSTLLLSSSSETLCFSSRTGETSSLLPEWGRAVTGLCRYEEFLSSFIPAFQRAHCCQASCLLWVLKFKLNCVLVFCITGFRFCFSWSAESAITCLSAFQLPKCHSSFFFFLSYSLHPWQFMPKQAKKSFYCHLVSEDLKDDVCIFSLSLTRSQSRNNGDIQQWETGEANYDSYVFLNIV